jgi:hypothetical protein
MVVITERVRDFVVIEIDWLYLLILNAYEIRIYLVFTVKQEKPWY